MQNAVNSAVIFWAGVIIKAKQAGICESDIGFGNTAFVKYKARFALKKADKGDFNYVFVRQKLNTGYRSIRIIVKIYNSFNKSEVSNFFKIFKLKEPN